MTAACPRHLIQANARSAAVGASSARERQYCNGFASRARSYGNTAPMKTPRPHARPGHDGNGCRSEAEVGAQGEGARIAQRDAVAVPVGRGNVLLVGDVVDVQ